jgi:hypothetical protein
VPWRADRAVRDRHGPSKTPVLIRGGVGGLEILPVPPIVLASTVSEPEILDAAMALTFANMFEERLFGPRSCSR